GRNVMTLPKTATRDEWLTARKELLAKEKDLTRRRDALNIERRNLPMVEITKDYVFAGPAGRVRLVDIFEGRRQLIVYHFMFDPEWEEGCPSCTAGTDELSDGFFDHLHTRDTTYAMVSRAPLEKLERWKAKKGWTMPWYSSFGTDFNYDFGVTIDASAGADKYNFRTLDEYAAMGQESMKTSEQPYEMPGRSCFLRVDGRVFKGRRRQAGAGLIPPGQYVVDDFPVLTAGPTPFTSLQDWDFSIVDETEAPAARWTWDEFRALPAEDVTVDIHCVTKWSKLG